MTMAHTFSQIDRLLEAAHQWAEVGVPVFPTGDDKRPLTPRGFYDASTDPEKIKAMFDAAGSLLHGIGGRMGAASGLFAIDADTYKAGAAGEAARAYIQGLTEKGLMPDTRIHATRSGGRHYIFRAEEFPNCKPSQGVEVKGEGGYIVLPPSPGYSVEREGVAIAPPALVESLKAARATQAATTLDSLKQNVLSGDDFHDSLTQLAAKLSAAGEPIESVQAALIGLLNASVAANPSHLRHDRWLGVVTDRDGELTRIVRSAHAKFNASAKTDALREVMSAVFAQPSAPRSEAPSAILAVEGARQHEEARSAFCFTMVSEMEIREPQFLIAGVLEENALIQIFGEPGVGKSLIAYDMAACIATGQDFHGSVAKQGAVIILAGEGHNGIKRRFAAWERHTRRSLDGLPLHVSQQPAQLLDVASVQAMLSAIDGLIAEHGVPALLVVDTLARNFGPGDENSNRDMSLFVAVLDGIRSRYGCSVLVVHHSGHADAGRGRGASALRAAVDAEFAVKREGPSGLVLCCTKMKDATKPADIPFVIESVQIGRTAEGVLLDGPALSRTLGASKPTQRAALSEHERGVVAAFAAISGHLDCNSPVSRDTLKRQYFAALKGVKPDAMRQRFNRALSELRKCGLVLEVDGGFILAPEFRQPDDASFTALKSSAAR